MSLPAADRMHCEDLIPATQASSIPMALPHEGIVLRHTFTNILPGVLVLDFYENYYIDDTEDDIYEARDELRDEMLRWAQHFRFKQFSILIQEMKIDTSSIHAPLGVFGLSGMVFLGPADSGQQTLAESLARHPGIHTTWHKHPGGSERPE